MKNILYTLITMSLLSSFSYGQCDPNVPNYVIDLTGAPDSTWTLLAADAQNRLGQCCSATSNENCISFTLTLDENCAGVFFDYDGAGAFGSLAWQLDCGPEYDMNDTICISGPGTFYLTFCKPGTDNGNYTLVSVPKPTFPEEQFVPLNCLQPVEAYGVTSSTITWTSISPGNPGDYDYLLDCTDCLEPTFTPDSNAPNYIEYQVCGYPIMDYCVGSFTFCDTVGFTTQDSLLLTVDPVNPTFCSGGNATINANATGGDGNYEFYWYDNAMVEIATGPTFVTNVAGTYYCEVRDGNYDVGSCDGFIESFTVVEVSPPVVDAGVDQVLCVESPIANLVGTIQNATGGIWTGGNGTYTDSNTDLTLSYNPTPTEMANGSVTLTLTSTGAGGGCLEDSDDVIIFFNDVSVDIAITSDYNGENISCSGADNGMATATPSGGVAPYSYSWSNGQSSATATNLYAGSYDVTVWDDNGCMATNSVILEEPDSMSATVVITDVSCNGGNDGAIDITPSGGTLPYSYQWSNGATTEDINNIPAGIYSVIVLDANDCFVQLTELIVDPTAIDLEITITDALCRGDENGSADLTAIGGTSPYAYQWSNGETTQDVFNLGAGDYTVTVTDDNGCFTDITGTVDEPAELWAIANIEDVRCYGQSNGSITVVTTGGTPPYAFLWTNGSASPINSNLAAGNYRVVITDDNGCEMETTFIVSQPDSLWATLEAVQKPNGYNISYYGDNDGSIDLEVNGGINDYSYNWSNGSTEEDLDNIPAGYYEVLITDSQQCTFKIGMEITQPFVLEAPTAMSPNGDGDNDTYFVKGLDAYPDNKFIVTNRWGNVVFETDNYRNDWSGVHTNGNELPEGVYYVIIEIEGEEAIKTFVELRR